MNKRPALGKGLSALIPEAPGGIAPRVATTEADVDRLVPNQFQPRAHADQTRLQELADSIKANGVIQPIVVRRVGDRFHIIAGERRWRAAKLAGLLRVPIAVRDIAPGNERSILEMALIETLLGGIKPLETGGLIAFQTGPMAAVDLMSWLRQRLEPPASMVFGSLGSCCVTKPSPPPTVNHIELVIEPCRRRLGPHHEPLSWSPPQTRYGTWKS